MALTGTDIAVAIAIAILVIAFAMGVWPGYARVQPADVEGNWASRSGDLYQIRARPDISARAITVIGSGLIITGELFNLRGIRAGDNLISMRGSVGLDGSITWQPSGVAPRDVWIQQGVKHGR
jgi:hypothetical protein